MKLRLPLITLTLLTSFIPKPHFPGKSILFVGTEFRGKVQHVCSVVIIPLDSVTISYQLDILENWVHVDSLKGIAQLDTFLLNVITDRGKAKPAYLFTGKTKGKDIEILIAVDRYGIAQMTISDPKKANKTITPIMFAK